MLSGRFVLAKASKADWSGWPRLRLSILVHHVAFFLRKLLAAADLLPAEIARVAGIAGFG